MTCLKIALRISGIALLVLLVYVLGAYSHYRNAAPVRFIKTLHDDYSGKAERKLNLQADARAARALLISRTGGFGKAHEQVAAALDAGNSQRDLYSDMAFLADFDSAFCPNGSAKFLTRFQRHEKTCTRIEYENTDYKTYAMIIQAAGAKGAGGKGLLIYNHGHGGMPKKDEPFAERLLRRVLDQGNDVMIVNMPFTGLDATDYRIRAKTWDGWAEFNPLDMRNSHNVFELFDTGSSHFIRYFIDNAVVNALHVRPHYAKIDYLGFSGGATSGLYTCAALKDILSKCILVAGVMPAKFRLDSRSAGDAEQLSSSLLKRHGVIELVTEISHSSTALTLVYNSADSCCFGNPAARAFKEEIAGRKLANVGFVIRDSDVHGYDPDAISGIIEGRVR